MKKRLVTLMVAGTLLCSTLAGCSSASDTETAETLQTQEETVVEDTDTTIDESVEEEITEEEIDVETLEDATTVTEAEPMTFEREDFTLNACVTNFGEDYEGRDYRLIVNDYTYSSNEYMDMEIMTELANRGYDIDGFTVTWMVAANESGEWSNDEYSVDYYSFENTDEYFVKLYPVFIKTDNIDSERIVYNTNCEKDDLTHYKIRENTDTNVYYAIHQAVADMKADENYEEIDFKIPDSYFKTMTEKSLINNVASEEDIIVKDLTLNDWYNGMIYAMFVSKTVDLDGLFDHDCTS